jgi:hypothetical protein
MSKTVETKQAGTVRYDSLILVIFTEEQLQRYREKYATSATLSIFDIAKEMKADAQEVLNSFDFLDFAEAVLQQTDSTAVSKTSKPREKTKMLQRL